MEQAVLKTPEVHGIGQEELNTYEIKLLDSTEKTVLAIGQEYSESGANEAYYYSGTGAKTNISSGTVFGSPNITKRSSSNWRIENFP